MRVRRVAAAVVTRVVAAGKEDEFARRADDADRAVAGFPGHLGAVRLLRAQDRSTAGDSGACGRRGPAAGFARPRGRTAYRT
ncbi:hypothetical protein [Streptomyces sp. NPDC086519]|uniref:hypothetical protein n=1 Tax=Streptomyces sp. NPDC086519 TaxID=3154863 RepID=UPI00341C1FE9